MKKLITFSMVICMAALVGCTNMSKTQQGALSGGDAGTGAIIGGVLGGVAGGIYGNNK